jgi:mannosyl-glycoprotein endo-beta-N-acetylglucosaminidase
MKRRQILAIAALPTLLSLSAFSMPAYAASTPTQILRYGTSGQAVTLLQTMLNQAGYSVGTSSNQFDTRTLAEVKAFQQAHNLTPDGIVGPQTWVALQAADAAKTSRTSSTSTSHSGSLTNQPVPNLKLNITVAGQSKFTPSGFVQNGTTYMPLWYVQQALENIGVHNTWNDQAWDLTPPANATVNLNNIQAGSGSKSITIQGKVIYQVDSFVATDPSSGSDTTYIPIWYVMQVLDRMGISSTWSNQAWSLTALAGSSSSSSSGSASGTSGSSTGTPGAGGSTSSSGSPTPPKQAVPNVPVHVTVSGQHFSDPSGIVNNNTTYIPIWYVMQALQKIGVQNTWDQTTWNMAPPANTQVDLKNVQAGSGAKSISILGTVVTRIDSLVANDPNSGQATTYMPIWYVMQALNRMGLATTWSNQTWNLPNWPSQGSAGTGGTSGSGNTTGSGSTGTGGTSGSTSGNTGSTGTGSTTGNASFTNVDLRFNAPGNITATSIDSFLAAHPSPLTGLGASFVNAQTTYGVDANYLVSQAILESGWGKSSIAQVKNNLFGYGAYDANPGNDAGTFPSDDYAIQFQAWMLRQSYLAPGSKLYVSPTLNGLGVHYATDPNYATSIASIMNQFAGAEGDAVTSYTQYTSSVSAPTPQSSTEPVYYYNGAMASVIGSQFYNNGLPYYPDMISGENDMFYGTLHTGSMGSNVKSLQSFLNQQVGAGLTVDGDFGQMTANAVKAYQTGHGLPVTGVWDFTLWSLIAPSGVSSPTIPAGTTISIDKMMQGMANGFVTEWDHVVGFGWVDAHYIALQNVYQAKAASPLSTETMIAVYSAANPSQQVATLHSGDYVVCSNPVATGGMYAIQIANSQTGQPISGLISAEQASLVQVPPPNQS